MFSGHTWGACERNRFIKSCIIMTSWINAAIQENSDWRQNFCHSGVRRKTELQINWFRHRLEPRDSRQWVQPTHWLSPICGTRHPLWILRYFQLVFGVKSVALSFAALQLSEDNWENFSINCFILRPFYKQNCWNDVDSHGSTIMCESDY